jgi:hypothetical protein
MYIAFADQGKTVITGDAGNLYRWRTLLADVTAFTCAHLTRDLYVEERALYRISGSAPTCPK